MADEEWHTFVLGKPIDSNVHKRHPGRSLRQLVSFISLCIPRSNCLSASNRKIVVEHHRYNHSFLPGCNINRPVVDSSFWKVGIVVAVPSNSSSTCISCSAGAGWKSSIFWLSLCFLNPNLIHVKGVYHPVSGKENGQQKHLG